MGFTEIVGFVSIVILGSLYLISTQNLELELIDVKALGYSKFDFISPLMMAAIRGVITIIIWSTNLELLTDKVGLQLHILGRDKQVKVVSVKGLERFTTFTVWSWTLQGIYFTFVTMYSLLCLYSTDPTELSKSLMVIIWVSFEISFSIAFIVSLIVTYVLIPGAKSANRPVDLFFALHALLMHNANLIFVGVDLILNRIPLVSTHFPFVLLYGIAYAIFSWIWFEIKGIFYYDFLDYYHKTAIFWYVGLMCGVGGIFLLSSLLSTGFQSHAIWPYPVLIGLIYLSIKIKNN